MNRSKNCFRHFKNINYKFASPETIKVKKQRHSVMELRVLNVKISKKK
jgi:hypothetical protein